MATTDHRVESAFYTGYDGGYLCGLCPHRCRIPYGSHGRCGSRRADDDFLVACNYGRVSSLCIDPVEKKPLNHYRPGTLCLSVGGIGCNMRCLHCQNHSISMPEHDGTSYVSPEDLVSICRREGMDCIAFTYNEPMIWFEYIRDVCRLAPDIRAVLVTNGLVEHRPLAELCRIVDAMNIDVKGFTEGFYNEVCGARLSDVLDSVRTVFDSGVHLELTYLVIPGYNDSGEEVEGFCRWVRDTLSSDVPVHFSRFHPDNRMLDVGSTPESTMLICRDIGKGIGLRHVYIGNMMTDGGEDTVCPGCGRTVIRRRGYDVDVLSVEDGRCAHCGHDLNIRRGRTSGSPTPGRTAVRRSAGAQRAPSASP